MFSYYGHPLSPNQLETGEGFLICRNVPIARTGQQEYLGTEIGLDSDNVVEVFRPPEEVFSKAAIASFEGKPVTDDHPSELVTPENVVLYSKGHAQNVREGSGEWEGYLIADLHIQDADLIEKIKKRGKREISCGYECTYEDNGDGTFTQREIRGNHVAVVDQGRAGKKAAIMDSNKKQTQKAKSPERKNMKNKSILELFGLAAKDKTEEEISRLAMDTAEAMEADATEEKKDPASENKDIADEEQKKLYDYIDQKFEELKNALAPQKEEKVADPIDEALEKLGETLKEEKTVESNNAAGDENGEEAVVVSAEEMDGCKDEKTSMDAEIAKHILKSMKASIAGIKDEKQRKEVTDALLGAVTKKTAEDDLVKIANTLQKNAKAAADKAPKMSIEDVQAAYNKFNPHIAKEDK